MDWPKALGVIAVLLGVVLRMRAFTAKPAMYIDEYLLALNLAGRSWGELWGRLDFGQTAAPLYLVLGRSAGLALGFTEHALRTPALIAGCLALPLMWQIASQFLPREDAALAVLLFSVGPTLLLYANFVKPYASDAFVSVGLLALALRAAALPDSPRRLVTLGLGGLAALLVSSPSAFLLASIGCGHLYLLRRASRRQVAILAGAGVAWLALLLLLLCTVHADLIDPRSPVARYMAEFWRPHFLDLDGSFFRRAGTVLSEILSQTFLPIPVPVAVTWILAGLVAIGTFACGRAKGWVMSWLLGAPCLLLALAAGANRYPAAGRVALFIAPLTAIALAGGLGQLLRLLPVRARTPAFLTVAGVLLLPVPRLMSHPMEIVAGDLTRERIRDLNRADKSLRPVYLSPMSVPAWLFYTTNWSRPDTTTLRRVIRSVDLTGPAPLFPPAWAVLGHPPEVPDSGLAFNLNGRLVLVGRPSGPNEGRQGIEPDWAVREAARLRRESRVCSEMLLRPARRREGAHPQEETVLLEAIREAGGEIEETWAATPPAFTVCFRHAR